MNISVCKKEYEYTSLTLGKDKGKIQDMVASIHSLVDRVISTAAQEGRNCTEIHKGTLGHHSPWLTNVNGFANVDLMNTLVPGSSTTSP